MVLQVQGQKTLSQEGQMMAVMRQAEKPEKADPAPPSPGGSPSHSTAVPLWLHPTF